MNDDLKYNNTPGAELEKLSRELEEQNKLEAEEKSETEIFNVPEPEEKSETEISEVTETEEESAKEEKPIDNIADSSYSSDKEQETAAEIVQPDNENVLDTESYHSTAAPRAIENNSFSYSPPDQEPPNTGTNRPPRTNTLRNRNPGAQKYPPNTNPNNLHPRVNTVRNRNSYPQNNYNSGYNPNGYRNPPNTSSNNQNPRTNTVRNRNAYPQNNYNSGYYNYYQNGYQYPPQASYPRVQPQSYAPYYYNPSPKELEKLSLSKDTSLAGATTITVLIVMYIVAIIIEVIAVFCGVTHDIPDASTDPYIGFTPMGFYLYEGLSSLLSMFIPGLIIIKISKRKITNLMPFKKIEGKKLFAIVMCGMSVCMIAQLMGGLIGINFGLFGVDLYDGLETATAAGFWDVIMNSICTALIPALVEEFVYRGLVTGILKEHDETLAIVGSAFLFGMAHGNFGQIPFAFVVGLILAYVRVKTNSMLPGILIHFGNNFYAVIINTISEILPYPYGDIIDIAVILILIVIGFISTNYLTKNHKDLFKLEKKQSYLTYKEKLKVFFKTGTVIACTILLTVMSFAILLIV